MNRPPPFLSFIRLAVLLGAGCFAGPALLAQSLPDALTPATGFAPALTVSDSYAQTLKTTTGGPEVVTTGTTKVSITANITGIVLANIDENTEFSISVGDLSVAGALGDAPGYVKGKTTAFIPFNTNDNGTPKGTNGVKLTWTATRLTVAITRSLADMTDPGSILAASMAGQVDPKVRDTVEASLVFGPASAATRPVFMQGTAAVKTQSEVELNSVTLTGAGDFIAPTVTITAPKNNIVAGPNVTVSGTAKDTINLARVEYAVNPASGTWINVPFTLVNPLPPAAPGWGPTTATWTFNLTNRPEGTTVIWVRAVDLSGNEAKPAMVSFYRNLPAPLLAGRWDALVQPAGAGGLRGAVTFTTDIKGGLSGKLTLEGVAGSTPFTGALAGADLHAIIKVKGLADITLTGLLDTLAPATAADVGIAGQLQLAGAALPAATFSAFRSHWSTKVPLPQTVTGRYHVTLDDASAPVLGHSYLILTTAKAGTVMGTIKLADGTAAATWSGVLGSGGQVPVFVPLYASKGSLSLQPQLALDTGAVTTPDATWRRPTNFTDKQFTAGFALDLTAQGARHTAPAASTRIFGLTDLDNQATASWSGDAVNPAGLEVVTITTANKAVFTINSSALKITIAPATGLITGDFKLPGTSILARYEALIVGNEALGFYIAPAPAGSAVKRFGAFELAPGGP